MKVIEMKADIFVIPNMARRIDEEYMVDSLRNRLVKMLELNDLEINNDQKFIEVWLCSKPGGVEKAVVDGNEVVIESFFDHGVAVAKVNESRKHKRVYLKSNYKFIPDALLKGLVEGDDVNFTILGRLEEGFDTEEEVLINVTATLCQQAYRYRSFGNFEDAMKYADR